MGSSEPYPPPLHGTDRAEVATGAAAVGVLDVGAWPGSAAPAPGPVGLRPALAVTLSVLLGSVGVLAQVARDAPAAPLAPLALVAVAAVAAGIAQLDPGRRWSTAALPALLLVVAVVLVQPTVGRTPFVVVALATTLASGAWSRWRPLPGWPQRPTPIAALAVAPLMLLQVMWWRHPSVPVAVVLAAVAVVALELHARRAAWAERAAGGLTRVTTSIATFVATVFVGLVALPLLYLPGALVRSWTRVAGARRRPPADGWRVCDAGVDDAAGSRRLFARTPLALRRRRHRVSAAVALVAVAAAGVVVAQVVSSDSRDRSPGVLAAPRTPSPAPSGAGDDRDLFALEFAAPYSSLPAYRGVPWADQLQQDQNQQISWDDDVRTRYFNSDDGVRRTLRSSCEGCPRATVWLSGGSAVVGLGQRDEHTIASELVRLGDENGLALEVVNLGRNGQSMIEEVPRIESLLSTSEAPDLIVFLNGWNDVIIRVAFSFVYGPDPATWTDLDAMAHLQAINDRPDEFLASGIGPRAGRDAADLYASLQDGIDRVTSAREVDTAYFFQPDALVDATQLDGYEDLTNLSSTELMGSPFAQALRAATERLAGRTTNLRPVFVGQRSPMFAGLVHQNEAGARLTAAAMFAEMEPTLRRVAR